MKTNLRTFLTTLTFLFLLSPSAIAENKVCAMGPEVEDLGDGLEIRREYHRNKHGAELLTQKFQNQTLTIFRTDKDIGKIVGVKRVSHYKNGKKKGLTTLCSEDRKTGELEYKNGKLNGLKTIWYEHDSTRKRFRTRYKNGKKDGMAVEWYPSGRKKSTSHYKNGIEAGFRKEWDENGNLTYQENFVGGLEKIK